MLFAPEMSKLLATSSPRRPHAPAAPRSRRDLLRGLRVPHRRKRAAAAGRLLPRPADVLARFGLVGGAPARGRADARPGPQRGGGGWTR
jgi:hypothetical protein